MSAESMLKGLRTGADAGSHAPNIVLITADQQRADTVGPRSPSFLMTPHYDMLCREGTQFSRAYAQSPLCVPSRVSIMTGRSVFHHGLLGNGDSSVAVNRAESLPTKLHQNGYHTAAIGKMHFGPQRVRHGFDEMIIPDDYYREMERSGAPLQPMRHGLGQNELYPGASTVPEALTLTAWTAEQSVRYIRDRRDPSVPFFLWVSFSKPHPPFDPPEPYFSLYRDAAIPEPFVGSWRADECPPAFLKYQQKQSYDLIPPEVIRAARAAYYGLITQVDYHVGRVLSALQDVGILDSTCILYTSDHGEFLGDHRAGAKSFFYESSAHVPMVLRLPQSSESRRPGTTCDALVTHSDIMATLLDVAGCNDVGTGPDDSRSLRAVATGRAKPREYLEGTTFDPTVARDDVPLYYGRIEGNLKYIWYPDGAVEQLFDLVSDPHELHNVASDPANRATLEQMRVAAAASEAANLVGLAKDGRLITQARDDMDEAYWRNLGWPGLHTESYALDVRH